MPDELTTASSNLPASPSPTSQTTYINEGNGIIAGTINGGLNISGVSAEELLQLITRSGFLAPPQQNNAMEISRLCRTHFNLFVLENEEYKRGTFSIARMDALTRYTHDKEHFSKLDDPVIHEIQNLPCIFAMRNDSFASSDEHRICFTGKVEGISIRGSVIAFSFKCYNPPIPQNVFNQDPQAFHLASSSLRNELDVEHWSIKDVDLLEELRKRGIEVK